MYYECSQTVLVVIPRPWQRGLSSFGGNYNPGAGKKNCQAGEAYNRSTPPPHRAALGAGPRRLRAVAW